MSKPTNAFQICLISFLFLFLFFASNSIQAESNGYESWNKPFDLESSKKLFTINWRKGSYDDVTICALLPKAGASRQLAQNYGMVKRVKELSIKFRLYHLSQGPIQSIAQSCLNQNPDLLIIDDSPDIDFMKQYIPSQLPIVSLSPVSKELNLKGATATSHYEAGKILAKTINNLNHNEELEPLKVAFFPGTHNSTQAQQLYQGVFTNLKQSRFNIKHVVYTPEGYRETKNEMTEFLVKQYDIDIIIGNGLVAQTAAEVAVDLSIDQFIQIYSSELTAQVFREMRRAHSFLDKDELENIDPSEIRGVVAAVSHSPVVQGELAIELALDHLKSNKSQQQVSPKLKVIFSKDILSVGQYLNFAPYGYRETLEVN